MLWGHPVSPGFTPLLLRCAAVSDFSEDTVNSRDPANIVRSSIFTTFGHLLEAFLLEPINNEKIFSG